MHIKTPRQFPRDTIEQLLQPIPFYRNVKQDEPWQFDVLLEHSRIVYFCGGEAVLHRGETDRWLYFLLKGRLAVYADDNTEGEPVNYITPGEVFGDLSMLVNRQRTANVIADSACREVVVFGTDFKAFGELEDFSVIALVTKLAYYRNTVLSLRWKLDVYRVKYPEHELSDRHHRVKLYTGEKGGVAELRALFQQAQALAQILVAWNQAFGNIIAVEAPDRRIVDALQQA